LHVENFKWSNEKLIDRKNLEIKNEKQILFEKVNKIIKSKIMDNTENYLSR